MLIKNILLYFSIRIGFLHTKAVHLFSYTFLSELFWLYYGQSYTLDSFVPVS